MEDILPSHDSFAQLLREPKTVSISLNILEHSSEPMRAFEGI